MTRRQSNFDEWFPARNATHNVAGGPKKHFEIFSIFLSGMHVVLEYTEEVKTPFSESFFQKIVLQTLAECPFFFLEEKDVSISVVAVTPEKIQELNSRYRGKESVTDILSFGEYTDRDDLEQSGEEEIFLGEIFFCPAFIAGAAKEDAVTFEREMMYIFSHGVLHLVGYDHEEEMFAIQERVTDALA